MTEEDVRKLCEAGRDYFRAGNLDKSIDYFQRAIAIDPKSCSAHIYLAKAYHGKGLLDDAQSALQVALEIDDANLEAHSLLGSLLLEKVGLDSTKPEWGSAKHHLTKALELGDDEPSTIRQIAFVNIVGDQFQAAFSFLEKWLSRLETQDRENLRDFTIVPCFRLWKDKKYDDCRWCLKIILLLDPDNARANELNSAPVEEWKEEDLKAWKKEVLGELEGETNATEFYFRGMELFKEEGYTEAIKKLQEALQLGLPPIEEAMGYLMTGIAYRLQEEYGEALSFLERGLEKDDSLRRPPGVIFRGVAADALGDVYFFRARELNNKAKFDEARAIEEKLFTLAENYGDCENFRKVHHQGVAHFSCAATCLNLFAQGQVEEEEEVIRHSQIVLSDPFFTDFATDVPFMIGEAHATLANLYLFKREYQKALPHLQEAVKFSYSEEERRHLVQMEKYVKVMLGEKPTKHVEQLLQDVALGSSDNVRSAVLEIGALDRAYLEELRPFLRPLLTEAAGEDPFVGISAAMALANLGDTADNVAAVLLFNLKPSTYQEPDKGEISILRWEILKSLSRMRGRQKVAEGLINAYRHSEEEPIIVFAEGCICALGAVGHESARQFLEYVSSQGKTMEKIAAEVSLELFGKTQFEDIWKRYEEGTS